MKENIEALIEKWQEILSEEKALPDRDWTLINLVTEFIDDLEDLK